MAVGFSVVVVMGGPFVFGSNLHGASSRAGGREIGSRALEAVEDGGMAIALVGRDRPLGVLSSAVDQAVAGRGSVVLVAGEAGIGKTSILGAAAEHAVACGAIPISGGGWDGDGAPGLWPWIQVVRGLQRLLPSEEWSRCRAAAGPGVGVLLGDEMGGLDSMSVDDGTFMVFDAVGSLLVAASRTQPLFVVLDDLHWADGASVRLLEFVQRQVTLEAIAVLAAYRDVEVDAEDHPLRELIHRMSETATNVRLGGLDRDAVGVLLTRDVENADDEAIDELHRRTGGNPFFVLQAAQLWSSTGSSHVIAPGIRDALDRRLARLPERCVDALACAALVGTVFELALVPEPNELEPAGRAGLIVPIDDTRSRFVHDLVRETLLDSVGEDSPRRHAEIVRRMDAGTLPSREGLAARVAHHAYAARDEMAVDDVVARLRAAAADATHRCAAEEAAMHLERAAALVPSTEAAWPALMLDLGNAQQRAGMLDQARRTFITVGEAARDCGDATVLAKAALGVHACGQTITEHAAVELELLAAARAQLDGSGDATTVAMWARVTAALSRTMVHELGQDRAESEDLSAIAVERARTAGDDEVLAFCLLARHDAIWQPGTAAERLALADEMSQAAQRAGDIEMAMQGSLLRMVALFEQGDPHALDEHRAFVAMTERARLPRFRYYALGRQATVATLQGEFAAATELSDRARELAEQIGELDALSLWADQRWEIARLQHRPDDFAAVVAEVRPLGGPHLLVLEALGALFVGDVAKALSHRTAMEELGVRWPRWARLMWLTFEADMSVAANDDSLCRNARALIEPYADQWAVLGGAVVVRGPLRYWLALLDLALGRADDAVGGFEAALAAAQRLGAQPWIAQASVGLARALMLRGREGDGARADELISSAARTAESIGMRGVAAEAGELAASRSTAEPNVTPSPAVFRQDGDVWTLGFAGHSIHMADAKGLHDLHALLASPGTDVAAAALLDPATASGNGSGRLGSDPVLDDRAKAEYRRRLEHLDGEIDSALARHADAAAAQLEAERDALLDELRRATGLGGRTRRLGDDNERARKTVTARIRDVLRRLDERHPHLAAHLRDHVTTGSWCRYEPAPDVDWTL
jgi:hypothetical protein